MRTTYYQPITRIFAFLAVSCAITAIAWTSRDLLVLAVGIPGLAAGHYYSWYRRDNVSTRRTLILFFFMLLLTLYMGQEMLLYGAGDRLLLARYLVYGLALGSFDLMRKRNLMASLLLGALLLTLISELALSLSFIVFPLLFTALGLVVVIANRVDVETSQAETVAESSWFSAGRAYLVLATLVILFSTALFLFMPRLTSRQVAQASWLPSRLDLRLPGQFTLPAKPGAPTASGILPSRQFEYSGSRADGEYIPLGYTGSLADQPVMYVRSRISSYWRGATLDEYDGRGWLPSSSSLTLKLVDKGRQEFVLPDSEPNLPGERVYWQAYYLLTDQPNAIFTGYRPGRIYLPASGPVLLERGTLYRALSAVPRLRPEQLRRDRVVSDDLHNLALPPISQRTAALAESIVLGAATDYDRAARLERFLLDNYPYDLTVEPLPPGKDAADFFLFEEQAGYCAHFATTMAVMARHLGLPARVAVGYLPGFIDAMTGAHVVRNGDAHAWVEIHFEEHGWVAFDPTPNPDASMGFAGGRNWVYFGLEDFTGVTLTSIFSGLGGNLSLPSLSIAGFAWLRLLGAAVVAAVLILLLRRRRRIDSVTIGYSILEGESRRAMLRLYHNMTGLLVKRGLPSRQGTQPPYEYAALISGQIRDGRELIAWLTEAASSAAYDSSPFDPAITAEASRRLTALRRVISLNS